MDHSRWNKNKLGWIWTDFFAMIEDIICSTVRNVCDFPMIMCMGVNTVGKPLDMFIVKVDSEQQTGQSKMTAR